MVIKGANDPRWDKYDWWMDTSDDGTSVLAVKNNKLYFNDEPIITSLSLQNYVNVSIVIGSISTLILAIVSVLQYFGI